MEECKCCGAPWLETPWGYRRTCIRCFGFGSFAQAVAQCEREYTTRYGMGGGWYS